MRAVLRVPDQVDGRHRRQPQDAPLEPGLLDGLLARHLLSPVLVGRRNRRLHAERRLAILDVAEDALRRREDQPVGRPQGLHLLDQAPGPVDVDAPGEIGRLIHAGRHDARQMHHRVHAVQRGADRYRIGDVAPDDMYTAVEAGRELARLRRFEVEGDDVVAFFEQRLQRGTSRRCPAHLSTTPSYLSLTAFGALTELSRTRASPSGSSSGSMPVVEFDGNRAESVRRAL